MFDDVPNGNQEMQGMSPQNTAEARVIVEILRTLLYTSIKEGAESPCSSPVLSVYTEVPRKTVNTKDPLLELQSYRYS